MASLVANVYGTNASNALGAIPSLLTATAGQRIGETQITAIAQAAINERVRRGVAGLTIPAGYYSGTIKADRLDLINTVVAVAGPGASVASNGANQNINSSNGQVQTGTQPTYDAYGNYAGDVPVYGPVPAPETITYPQVAAVSNATSFAALVGSRIRAPHINSLIDQINSSRAACTCNCNYCTCNCNYCTCNCNYSCTCNCNYSDEQVKTEIEYM
jgi:hypothetical protein